MYCNYIDRLAVCLLPDVLRDALGLLTDFARLPPGHYPIDGTRLFALVQEMETGYAEERLFEAHARYLDVQYLVSGIERIGYLPRGSQVVLREDRLEDSDIALYDSPLPASELLLTPGMYAVFEAGELHRPCCSVAEPAPIRKVVLKLRQEKTA